MRILTAGESHGQALTAIIEGFPKGVPVDEAAINKDLARRQKGFGRGRRMEIEKDRAQIISGVRNKITLGSPISLLIPNKDQTIYPDKKDSLPALEIPRPAHADLAGAQKFEDRDMRNILERASARETAARVAAGSLCKQLLFQFDIRIASFVISIGTAEARHRPESIKEILKKAETSPVHTVDPAAEKKMISEIEQAGRSGDTLGGIMEVWAQDLPPGLGSFMHYDQRLDSRIAAAMMSIPAVKGVEIGAGFEYARMKGSKSHDSIFYSAKKGFFRSSNNAGGIEGGISNGQTIVIRCAMKPIATLMKPLASVNLRTGKKADAAKVRSDVCAVAACAVVAEHMLAIVLAEAFLAKFGSDCLSEIRNNYKTYEKHLGL